VQHNTIDKGTSLTAIKFNTKLITFTKQILVFNQVNFNNNVLRETYIHKFSVGNIILETITVTKQTLYSI